MLNIYSFTQLVINYVLIHNQRYVEDYPMSKEMHQKDIKPAPCTLWKYFCEIKGNPRPISQATYDQYLYDLLPEKQASLSRKVLYCQVCIISITSPNCWRKCARLGLNVKK